jgi:hypothetical protein
MTPFRVGVSLILRYNEYVLMGFRKGSHGAGTMELPRGSCRRQ